MIFRVSFIYLKLMKSFQSFLVLLFLVGAGASLSAAETLLLKTSLVSAPVAPAKPMVTRKQVHTCKPGPWGVLEYYYTYLEPPDSLLEKYPPPPVQTTWRFTAVSEEGLTQFFQGKNFSEANRPRFLDRSIWISDEDSITLYPSDELVIKLTDNERRLINMALNTHRKFGAGFYYDTPFHFPGHDLNEWLGSAGLNDQLLDLVRRTRILMPGNWTVFGDFSLASKLVSSEDERMRFLRALSRKKTMILRLKITEDTNLNALAEYWTIGGASKDIFPILKSVFSTSGVEYLDITHLLPPTPRKLLYTYPKMSDGLNGQWRDCHWTSGNFLRADPTDRFKDRDQYISHMRESWTRVDPPYRFGDVLMLLKPGNEALIHSCVYIADDIVFTKNGLAPSVPWLFEHLDAMRGLYDGSRNLTLQGFRK